MPKTFDRQITPVGRPLGLLRRKVERSQYVFSYPPLIVEVRRIAAMHGGAKMSTRCVGATAPTRATAEDAAITSANRAIISHGGGVRVRRCAAHSLTAMARLSGHFAERDATKGSARVPVPSARSMHGAAHAILLGGLVAGALDIGAACLINWLSPRIILQAIASGLLGRASFQMGVQSAALGLVLQCSMSCVIAAIYVGAMFLMPIAFRRWVLTGCAYGVPVYIVMNYVVVPVSAAGHVQHFAPARAAENLLAMVWFGFVIAFFARNCRVPTGKEIAG
jgi:hypothetical protein